MRPLPGAIAAHRRGALGAAAALRRSGGRFRIATNGAAPAGSAAQNGRVDEHRLRRAAFGDQPDADVWAAAATGAARERWLAAVVLGGCGHYAAAATVLARLVHHPDRVLASLAASTLASHRRQLGGHAAARVLDARALAIVSPRGDSGPEGVGPEEGIDPEGVDSAGARTDALLGLAADAIGAGRPEEARRLHAAVEPQGWRARVRYGWLSAEIALASGHASEAVAPAESAARVARAAGALRHSLKSHLVLGTALVVRGTPDGVDCGVELLECVLNHTYLLGLRSLSWPTALVLAGQEPFGTVSATDRATGALSWVLRRADPVSRQLAFESPWVPTTLLRSGEPPNADLRTKLLTD